MILPTRKTDSPDAERATSAHTTDALLSSYLRALDEAESHRLLTELVSGHAAPLVRKIVGHKLRVPFHDSRGGRLVEDAEDVCGEAHLRLVARLREMKGDAPRREQGRPINDFRGYVATVAYHACHEYLRRKYPRRHGLKNKLRYLLSRDPNFAIWEGRDSQFLCGFEAWRAAQPFASHAEPARLQDAGAGETLAAFGGARQTALPDLLKAVFESTNGPVELDALVDFVATLTGVRDEPEPGEREGAQSESQIADLPSRAADIAGATEQRIYLARLWEEIKELPPRQRTALLLNLSDAQGRSYTELLALLGVASPRQIAEALEIPATEFEGVWNDLPLDDRVIAARLNLTRQQIINLRKSARERLARRMRASKL